MLLLALAFAWTRAASRSLALGALRKTDAVTASSELRTPRSTFPVARRPPTLHQRRISGTHARGARDSVVANWELHRLPWQLCRLYLDLRRRITQLSWASDTFATRWIYLTISILHLTCISRSRVQHNLEIVGQIPHKKKVTSILHSDVLSGTTRQYAIGRFCLSAWLCVFLAPSPGIVRNLCGVVKKHPTPRVRRISALSCTTTGHRSEPVKSERYPPKASLARQGCKRGALLSYIHFEALSCLQLDRDSGTCLIAT